MARVSYLLIVLLLLTAGVIFLQIFLSGRESKWPGLVLPVLCMLYPLILILNVAATGNAASVMATIIMSLFVGSIPAAVLLAVYFVCRGKRNKKQEMKKMSIQDL